MLQDGITLTDTGVATNFQIQNGPVLPVTGNNEGELFYLTEGQIGLYIHSNSVWTEINSSQGQDRFKVVQTATC